MSANSPNMLNIKQRSPNEEQEWLQTVFVGFRVTVESSIRILHEDKEMMKVLSLKLQQCGITNESGSKKFVESSVGVFGGPYYINLSDTDLSLLNEHKFDAASIQLQANEAWEEEVRRNAVAQSPQPSKRPWQQGPSQSTPQSVSFAQVASQAMWTSSWTSSSSSSSSQPNLKEMSPEERYNWFKTIFVGFDIHITTATGDAYYFIFHKDDMVRESLLQCLEHYKIIKSHKEKEVSTRIGTTKQVSIPMEGGLLVLSDSHFRLLEKYSLVLPLHSYIACRKAGGEGFTLFGGFNKKEKIEGAHKLIHAIEYYNEHGNLNEFKGALTPREAGALQDGDLFNNVVRNIISVHPVIGKWINSAQEPAQKNKMGI